MKKMGALFSGIGGFCSGFESEGFTTSWANELDNQASDTYEANFKNKIIRKSITELNVNSDALESIDVLHAGFPCQSFSQAGERKGFEDERGKLFFEIIRLIKGFQNEKPKVLVFENVPHLLTGNGGQWFARIKFEIQSSGYWFSDSNAQILDPYALGLLPQRRERLFMIAVSTDHFKSNKFEFPKILGKSKPHYKDFIKPQDNVDDSYYLPHENRYFGEMMKSLKDKPEGTLVQYRKYYTRDTKEGVCPTLTANMGSGGHNVPFLRVGERIRKLTEYECASLQGFNNIKFPNHVPRGARYTQVGNSVAVPVAQLLAKNVKNLLDTL
jgi:DNA (cytosine-5)-methyltransferase 1